MADFRSLIYELEGHVATITLNRPEKLNAMSWTMFTEIKEAFDAGARDAAVRCIVVTGAGGAFCSGADLTDPENLVSSPFELKDRMRAIHQIVLSVAHCPKPTIAKVAGVAAGAGCNLALTCDLVVASTDARFAELFVKRGLVVDFGGTWALSRAMGLQKAKEMALLGGTLSAEEADRWGLVARLCRPDELDQVVKDLAAELVALPPRTVTLIKENLNRAAERSLEENLDAETAAQSLAFSSEDTREAVMAWVEKREPRFTGR
ncbi:MAG: hypothetical protein QOF16_1472 [Actinomycetota bacterium]|nr:hypothetical protein [Actinomycetota bacterium]MEA2487818.1 hypothetical protein [Actinomycetota bacterium]